MKEHGEKLDNELSGAAMEPKIEAMCVNNHSFTVKKADLRTTETGKSAIAFCPVCGGVSRISKANVGKLYGFKRSDTKAFNAALKAVRSAQLNITPIPPPAPSPAGSPPDLSRGGGVVILEDKEYEAKEEEVEGPDGQPMKRYRVRQEEDDDDDGGDDDDEDDSDDEDDYGDGDDDEDDDDDEDEEREDRRRERRPRPRKTIRRPKPIPERDLRELDARAEQEEIAREREEDRREKERRVAAGKAMIAEKTQKRRRPVVEDEEFDPNIVLKEIVAEAGLDEPDVERIFDYIDLQPDGWQPAQVIGILDMYMPRAAAQRLVARYQAELYKEQKRKEREQQMMSIIGPAAGNIRLSQPGVNQPVVMGGGLNQGGGYTFGGQPFNSITTARAQDGSAFAQPGQMDLKIPSGPQDPRAFLRNIDLPRKPSGASMDQVRDLVESTIAREMAMLRESIMTQRREDDLRKKIDELEHQLRNPQGVPAGSSNQEKYMDMQNTLLTKLLENALNRGNDELNRAILEELRALKKSSDQPFPGINGSAATTNLRDVVELQKLSNDINIAKMELQENLEGKKFTKELIESALQQIGQTVASIYTGGGPPGLPGMGAPMTPPPSPPPVPATQPMIPPPQPASVEKIEDKTYSVTSRIEGGQVQIPCPACGKTITASPGDTVVSCSDGHRFSLEPPGAPIDTPPEPAQPAQESPRPEIKPEEPDEETDQGPPKEKRDKGVY